LSTDEDILIGIASRFTVGMLSHQQERNDIEGKKQIILNPSETQKRDFERVTFEENEVYGVDVLISSGEGKVCNP
jgi:hypothetical protein